MSPLRPHVDNDELLADGLRRGLHVISFSFGFRRLWIHQHAYHCRLGHQLPQQFQPFGSQLPREKRHTGDISAGPVEARDKALLDRITAPSEDDRNRRRRGLGHEGRRGGRNDHSRLVADQFGDQQRQPVRLIVRKPIFDNNILAFDKARLLEALAEAGNVGCGYRAGRGPQKSDHRHDLLRLCDHRPRRRSTQRTEKCPPPHAPPQLGTVMVASQMGAVEGLTGDWSMSYGQRWNTHCEPQLSAIHPIATRKLAAIQPVVDG